MKNCPVCRLPVEVYGAGFFRFHRAELCGFRDGGGRLCGATRDHEIHYFRPGRVALAHTFAGVVAECPASDKMPVGGIRHGCGVLFVHHVQLGDGDGGLCIVSPSGERERRLRLRKPSPDTTNRG